jgi:mannose-6-phosphate isomerase-like protein (cupin superfamily)
MVEMAVQVEVHPQVFQWALLALVTLQIHHHLKEIMVVRQGHIQITTQVVVEAALFLLAQMGLQQLLATVGMERPQAFLEVQ